jgi:hypothetical protein
MFFRPARARLLDAKRLTIRAIMFCAGVAGYAISGGAQAAVIAVRTGPIFSTTVVAPPPRPVFWVAPPPRPVFWVAPPSPRVVVTPGPRAGWIWSPGYWRWTGHDYVWIDGIWMTERPGFNYVAAHWVREPGGWIFIRGGWRRRPF